MDTANAITALMLESSTSQLPDSVEPRCCQELSVSNMQYPSDFLEIGRQITQLILTSPSPEMVLPRIAAALGKIFQVDFCLIAAVADHQAILPSAVWQKDTDLNLEESHSPSQLLGHPVLKALLKDIPLLVIPELQTADSSQKESAAVQAVLGIQTQFQARVNGMVVLGRRVAHAWTEEEKELLKVVCEPVGLAISQVQMHRQVLLGTQYQSLINQLTLAIRNALELEQILQLAMSGTAQVLQVERSFILLLKYADPLIKSRSLKRIPKATVTVMSEFNTQKAPGNGEQTSRGIEEQESKIQNSQLKIQNSFALSECQLSQQAFTQAPEALVISGIEDQLSDPQAVALPDLFNLEAMPALIMVPLMGAAQNSSARGAMLGFLVLQHHQPRFWQSEELELVKSVGAQTSTAIIQNQTLRQVQGLVEERTAQLKRSLEVQAKLYEKTRQQVEQLRHLNQLKDEFLNTMNHELRTPLTSMSVAIRMLRQVKLPPERHAKYLEILEQQCSQEINLINDLLALQQLENRKFPINLQKIDLKQLIEELTESFKEKWADKELTLVLDLPKRALMLQTDADSLRRILLELLTNAGKYSKPETTVYVSAFHQVDQQVNQIVINLNNIGSRISPDEQKTIFEKFTRGQGVTQKAVQGTGLGLALVKSLVEYLNGTITVSSCPEEKIQACENCFTLTLPQIFDSTQAF